MFLQWFYSDCHVQNGLSRTDKNPIRPGFSRFLWSDGLDIRGCESWKENYNWHDRQRWYQQSLFFSVPRRGRRGRRGRLSATTHGCIANVSFLSVSSYSETNLWFTTRIEYCSGRRFEVCMTQKQGQGNMIDFVYEELFVLSTTF